MKTLLKAGRLLRSPEPPKREAAAFRTLDRELRDEAIREDLLTEELENEERDNAPEKDEVQFEAPPAEGPADGDDFEEFEDVEDADDPAAPTDSDVPSADLVDPVFEEEPAGGSVILGRLLGNEQIFVLLEIDILLFKPKAVEEGKSS